MLKVFVLGLISTCLISCDVSNLAGPESFRVKEPSLGSVFTYITQQIDRNSAVVSGTESQYVETVIAVDTTLSGKNGVYVVKGEYPNPPNAPYILMSYYFIDDNQDIQWRYDGGGTYSWVRIPITTLAGTIDTAYGKVDYQSGKKADMRNIYTYTYIGDETITVDTMSIVTRKFRASMQYRVTFNGTELYKGVSESTLHYAPYLGMMVQSTSPATYDAGTNTWNNGYKTSLKIIVVK